MLIRNAEIAPGVLANLRIAADKIAAIGKDIPERGGERVIDAAGAMVLPALHDHHIHFLSFARAAESVQCGPPEATSADQMVAALSAGRMIGGWIRGVSYHESVAGEIDRHWLDAALPRLADTPVRIQHRTGRLWLFNSAGVRALGASDERTPLEVVDGEATGRLYDADVWLRSRLEYQPPDFGSASLELARFGVASFTDATPGNSPMEWELFRSAQRRGDLRQDVLLMGGPELGACESGVPLRVGPTKFHLNEADLPDMALVKDQVAFSRASRRPVAFHCVTMAEFAFALSAFDLCGVIPGDRLEHAAIVPDSFLRELSALNIAVVTQPHFIFERGDSYRRDLADAEQPWLYRLGGLKRQGIPVAAGSDAPFGSANPWVGIAAAVTRRTREGAVIGGDEGVEPEDAIKLYLGHAGAPGGTARTLSEGSPATLCLLDRPWREAREALDEVNVTLTLRRGDAIWDRERPEDCKRSTASPRADHDTSVSGGYTLPQTRSG